ncbi:MAG TPA: alanine--tRNA ligase [Actinomycetota bacterium]|nr:alanine--tRNA ligase [Actinomycetota bacterium]
MRAKDARQTFLRFFEEQGHKVLPSSSLIPSDATVMFTVAGMVQFAPYFLGQLQSPYPRITTAQKCLRAGGKHNDLEEVGTSPAHHTFFEMLGNFSIGDYFKSEACRFAWDLCTGPFGLDPDRIWVSVYTDDDEAAQIWEREVGVPSSRIVRFGRKDNFWDMGGAGPCGPCSELFYDRGPAFGDEHPTGPDGGDENRYREFYNLVFMQFVQDDDLNIVGDLERKGIDTGMGFERMLTILQDVPTNYDTDVFTPIIARAEEITGARRDAGPAETRLLRILADHSRAVTFLIADGVMPSNEGRGYVLRRILRRSVTKARQVGVTDALLVPLCDVVIEEFGDVYPELVRNREAVLRVVAQEEERFGRTLEAGLGLLQDEINSSGGTVLSGEVAFRLYDTYGFPLEITQEVAQDAGLSVDLEAFKEQMTVQRDRSRAAHQQKAGESERVGLQVPDTAFLGYTSLQAEGEVLAVLAGTEAVPVLQAGAEADVVLDRTPFYPEGGGQIGDRGWLQSPAGRAQVLDTRKRGGIILHRVQVETGEISVGAGVTAVVDLHARAGAEQAHTATHIVHHQLRDTLGTHVRQMGSLVEPGRLRFDFSHFTGLSRDLLDELEEHVNTKVEHDDRVRAFETGFREAVEELGALAFFEEKYGDTVRVVEVGDYSRELCGGTHVAETGRIGLIKILGEGSIGSNVRRVEALTGVEGLRWVNTRLREAERAAEMARVAPDELASGVERLLSTQKDLQRALDRQQKDRIGAAVDELVPSVSDIGRGRLLVSRRSDDVGALRELAIALRDRLDRSIVILGTAGNGKANLVGAAHRSLVEEGVDMRVILQSAAAAIGGRAGGKPDLAMGGGGQPDGLDRALAQARESAQGALG